MNISEYDTGSDADVATNLDDAAPSNHTSISLFEHLFEVMESNKSNIVSHSKDSQHLATFLQQLFSKMSDNQSTFNIPPSLSLSPSSTGVLSSSSLSLASSLPASSSDTNASHVLSIISLWFVLIVNPIVILFGVIGNLLAVYILIEGNIAKLPVLFYTIMLNISDTLNLLFPVFIFWLDNCFNRTPERGYFRDKSNFLCKALMCPDQLFAALSAWYMCAISFNRWCSVCRPSWYFFRTKTSAAKTSSSAGITNNISRKKKLVFGSSILATFSHRLSFDCCCCLKRSRKYRQHLQAFRCIGIITLIGILSCLYPIFMHELRPVMSTNRHVFDLTQKITRTYAIVWNRCYYSRKHEYAYDIIGIILSSVLHILPLTSVAVMNIMIIVRLKKRQRMMFNTTHSMRSVLLHDKRKGSFKDSKKRFMCKSHPSSAKEIRPTVMATPPSQRSVATHKDQETLTETSIEIGRKKPNKVVVNRNNPTASRHQARDRNITIMLVSVALSYLILTLPYRLFWSYNVYIKRMHPEKLKSSVYLLKMHYIDHVLRTIRNVHYGTNFIFFIFLSKPFRRKFQQLFMGRSVHASQQRTERNSNTCTLNAVKNAYSRDCSLKLDEINENRLFENIVDESSFVEQDCPRRASLNSETVVQEDELHSVLELGYNEPVNSCK